MIKIIMLMSVWLKKRDIRQKITARYEGAGQLQEKFGGITYETGTRRIYIDVRTDVRIDP